MGTRHCEPSTTRESLPAPVGADTPTRHNIDLNLNSGLGRTTSAQARSLNGHDGMAGFLLSCTLSSRDWTAWTVDLALHDAEVLLGRALACASPAYLDGMPASLGTAPPPRHLIDLSSGPDRDNFGTSAESGRPSHLHGANFAEKLGLPQALSLTGRRRTTTRRC